MTEGWTLRVAIAPALARVCASIAGPARAAVETVELRGVVTTVVRIGEELPARWQFVGTALRGRLSRRAG